MMSAKRLRNFVRIVGVVIILYSLFFVFIALKADQTYKYAITRGRMIKIANLIILSYSKNNDIVENLKESLISNNCKISFFDEWGNDLIINHDENYFSIISYGKDGESGGDGFKQDIKIFWSDKNNIMVVESADISP